MSDSKMSDVKTKKKNRQPETIKVYNDDEAYENEFWDSQVFQGYDMYFLKKPITYRFTDPVQLSKTTYSYQVKNMTKVDVGKLNNIFVRYNQGLRVGINDSYVNGKYNRFADNENTTIDFMEKGNWMITILIQGYKTGYNGRPSPIWRLNEAKLV